MRFARARPVASARPSAHSSAHVTEMMKKVRRAHRVRGLRRIYAYLKNRGEKSGQTHRGAGPNRTGPGTAALHPPRQRPGVRQRPLEAVGRRQSADQVHPTRETDPKRHRRAAQRNSAERVPEPELVVFHRGDKRTARAMVQTYNFDRPHPCLKYQTPDAFEKLNKDLYFRMVP